MKRTITVETNDNYESCEYCMYFNDSEAVCHLRGCIHAVGRLRDCYTPKSEPPDDVIRCQDCIHAERPGHQDPGCKEFYGLGEWNDFCSRAERRTDE